MISKSLDKKLAEAAKGTGFAKALPMLRAEARECLLLGETKTAKVGVSRVGGMPELPRSVEWPAGLNEKGKPFGHATFLAQLNFADLPKLADLVLPRNGMLWIFARSWDDGVQIASIYDPAPGKLAPRKSPAKSRDEDGYQAPEANRPTPLRFTRGISLPFSRKGFVESLHAAGVDTMGLGGALGQEVRGGKIGGYSFMMEHDLYRWVAFRELRKPDAIFADYWNSMADYEKSVRSDKSYNRMRKLVTWIHENRKRVKAEAAAWKLLISIRSGFAGLEIGDGYSLDVFIREDALAAGDFSNLRCEAPMIF